MKDQKNRMVNERDFRQDPNYVAPDPEKKKLILKLGTMITDRYLKKYTGTLDVNDPEYCVSSFHGEYELPDSGETDIN